MRHPYVCAAAILTCTMSPVAELFLNSLLAHHATTCRVRRPPPADFDDCLITYSQLNESVGSPITLGLMKRPLSEIATWCTDRGMPPINSLVVRFDSRQPGDGYDQASGCSIISWYQEAIASVGFDGYPARI